MDDKERDELLAGLKELLGDYKKHKEDKAKQVPVPPTDPKPKEEPKKKPGFFDYLFG